MQKIKDKHLKQRHSRSLYAKDLVRRAHAHCELCQSTGLSLSTYEVPPVSSEADFERCILVCDVCRAMLEGEAPLNPDQLRCLNTPLWSETAMVRCVAVNLLNQLAAEHLWAAELLEQAYLTPHERNLLATVNLPCQV